MLVANHHMVERCNGGIKCAVITGDREKTGKRVVNMTPIFLVLLVAIDPIIAQNGGNISDSQYITYMTSPPTILVRPQSQQVKAGGIASFYCTAEGAPPPQIHWRKNGKRVSQSQSRYLVHNYENGALLRIEPVRPVRDNTMYECLAENGVGDAVSAEAQLRVYEAEKLPNGFPLISQAPTTKVVEMGHNAVLLCTAVGSPPPIISWVRDMLPIDTTNPRYTVLDTGALQITGSDVNDQGKYECVANNSVGTEYSKSAMLYVKEPGTAPRKVQARPLSSSTMVIQWVEPETPNGQVTGYKIYYTTDPNQPMASWKYQMVDNNQLTTISDLDTHTIYTIRVQALTSVGPGPLSTPVQIKTQQGVPSQPEMLTAIDIGETTVTLQWNKPIHSAENILSYELYWNDTYAQEKHHRRIPVTENYTLTGLYPNTLYYVWLAARSQRGEGATTIPYPVRTKQYVPGAPPRNVSGEAVSPTSIRVTWEPPPADRSNGRIAYYKLQVVESGRSDSEAKVIKLNDTQFVLDELKKWTEYRIWVLAGTSVGDGPPSYPISVRTHEDAVKMPGDPQDVKVTPINSTAIHVEWKPPKSKEQNGVIRGYHIHVQEVREEMFSYVFQGKDLLNEPIRRDVHEGVLEVNITGLQPDTRYSVQVAALTRKGDGDRSPPVHVRTPGGVPNRPHVNVKVLSRDPEVLELEWSQPTQTYGDLLGYRIRYGIKNQTLKEEFIQDVHQHAYKITDLGERGVDYEFRVAGQNAIGFGQETVRYWFSPEGLPTGAPTNLSYFFQTPDTVCVTWDMPLREHRNGQIIGYDVQFNKKNDHSTTINRNTTRTRAVFTNLEENTEYVFHVIARTSRGSGPISEKITIVTEKDMGRAPMSVKAVATSDTSVEVWWEPVPNRGKILGYQIFYTTTAVEDLDEWKQKTIGLTESADLVNLEKFTQYAITVAARYKTGLGRLSEKVTVKVKPEDVPLDLRAPDSSTHSMTLSWKPPIRLNPMNYKVSFDAVKEFVDSQGITQTQIVPRRQILLDPTVTTTTINELQPFTTYNVNVSAVPRDGQYRPPAKITITTQMAAPKPMVKPDFYGVVNGEEIQVILPQASEEYGPISHYYLIVVPEDKSTADKQPDELTEDMIAGKGAKQERENAPYIAAKFPHRDIPYTFHLGSGDIYDGYENRRLEKNKRYRIFVRAVVDTPRKHLYTSSPFSEYLSLDMREVPPGEPPRRPNPNTPVDGNPEVSVKTSGQEPGMVWVVGPIIAALMVSVFLVLLFVIKKRRQPCKTPDQAAVTRPLIPADISSNHAPSDPVEMRRLNFQTPGMVSHPPIPITELGNHIERLKANDNLKFSQEYESIEPGQQFTWDHSNMEVNASKNRYANVIAYDHSRVILQTIDGMSGTDYINANYCDGYRKQNAYVATQGPLQETFGDFWRMCWELRSSTIVMMTKLEERTRIKCDQYWPGRGSETYGLMTVTITDVQELATYCIRTFQISRAGYSERREIKQLQFTAWPDHGVPEHPAPFLQFLRRVRSLNPPDSGPLIVHCSAGVGRTGCFIVIDSMLERIKHEKMIDIYGHVTCLRAQRNYMVQTEDQYIFIHDALYEAVICGNTEVPARNLHSHIQKLMQPEIESITGMELEFKKLSNIKVDSSRFISANLPCNKHKNRLVHILPYECTRVCLQPQRNIEGSDYINASLIDGYRYRGAYIATQGPLCDTTDDFWRMLWEHNSTIVVMLTKLKEMGREKCHQYWPSDRSIRYQCFVVDPIAEYNMPQYILREFKVTDARDGASRTVRQFQFIDWPEQGVPKSGDGFIDFIGQVHKTKEQFGQDGPITVHCSAGVGRTGVFITLSIVLERMQYEGVVDIFQTVRILRTQRPAMVQTEDQYQFCYRASLEYLGSFDHYAN
ncbi:tyrosine-protein phosphatase Lar isoform X15 [Apis mellifera]|uniref:protein-tyrosine-phosphatase n=1 Tax=Apis mellifera TaxID=7460 RepID=A0A7M7MTP6_APIME|nr:tyrosine-protein phosphatase Lar isoform X15 [Apis mellifera]|eukprot:XP_026300847.1 tyrosine-protein phosphatase Lar isoform X15 [Apis mellifera]